ncbi:MAG: hypothetical protein ACHQ1G_12110, partial [Planctomycetota bacterium]
IPAVRDALPKDVYVRVPLDRGPPPPVRHLPGAADARGRRTDRFTGYRFAAEPSASSFLESLEGLSGAVEFMVHPGARPGTPFTSDAARDREADVLASESLADELARRAVRVVSFADLPCA